MKDGRERDLPGMIAARITQEVSVLSRLVQDLGLNQAGVVKLSSMWKYQIFQSTTLTDHSTNEDA